MSLQGPRGGLCPTAAEALSGQMVTRPSDEVDDRPLFDWVDFESGLKSLELKIPALNPCNVFFLFLLDGALGSLCLLGRVARILQGFGLQLSRSAFALTLGSDVCFVASHWRHKALDS